MATVDLNVDCGEGYGRWLLGDEAALVRVVTSANVACGGHAGDPDTIHATLALARNNGVAVGAHPGYADALGFGRRVIPMSDGAIERMVAHQIGALLGSAALAGVRVLYVKPHGALNNVSATDEGVASAIAGAVRAVGTAAGGGDALALLATAGSALYRAGEAAGLRTLSEAFADRTYAPDGTLTPRSEEGAVIRDPDAAAAHALAMIEAGALIATDGTRIPAPIDSLCVHGDEPHAPAVARAVRAALEGAGHRVAAFAAAEPAASARAEADPV